MKKLIALSCMIVLAGCTRPENRPQRARVGQPAPKLAIAAVVRGGPSRINGWEDFRGKAVVLEFWSPDCDPCVENVPHLNDLAKKFRDRPVVFISASISPRSEVEEFLKDHEMGGIVAADTPMETFRSFGGVGIPHTVLVDGEGRIAAFSYPSMVTEKTIENLMAGKPVESVEPEEEPEEGSA